ncbi:hypothetical protein ACFLUN_01560, partial [Chloroflexota bacterium]
ADYQSAFQPDLLASTALVIGGTTIPASCEIIPRVLAIPPGRVVILELASLISLPLSNVKYRLAGL